MITQKVSKSSIKPSLFKLRRLVLALVFLFAAQGVWGQQTYTWVGGDGDWNESTNWTPNGVPGLHDTARIYGNIEITIDTDVTISSLEMVEEAASYLEENFTTKITGSGSLTVTGSQENAIDITRCSGTNGVIGTLEVGSPLTLNCNNGTIKTHSGITFLIDSGATVNAKYFLHSAYGATPQSKLQIDGEFNVTESINLNGGPGNSGAIQLVIGENGTVKAKDILFGNTAYSNKDGDNEIGPAISNSGTIEVSNSFTIISGLPVTGYSGSGEIKLNGAGASFVNYDTGHSITIENLTCLDSSVISGTNTIKNLTAGTSTNGLGGKILTINGVQIIAEGGSISLYGTDTSSKLTITGNEDGNLILGNYVLAAQYLSLDTQSNVVSSISGTAYSLYSETTGSGTTNWTVMAEAEHVWHGSTTEWETDANWLPPSKPQTGDDVVINEGSPYPVISSADVTVNSITMNGASTLTVNNSKTLQVSAIALNDTSAVSVGNNSTIAITTGCDLSEKITGTGTLVLSGSESYTIPADKTIGINIENNGTLTCSGDATFDGSYSGTGTLVAAASGTTTFNANVDLSEGFTHNDGTVVLTATKTGGSAADLEGDNTFYKLTLSGNVNVKGENTIDTLTATGLGGKEITFAAGKTQTITTTLTLSGTDSDNPLELTSTGTWYLDCPDSCAANLQYLSVKNSNSTNELKVTNCTDGTGNSNWIFVGQEYRWTGNNSTAWNLAANWEPASIPCLGSTVIIPGGKTNYPVLPDGGINIADTDNGTITIASGASLNLNGQPFTVKSITNNGTVRLLGTETINGTMENGTNSTVEYYGDADSFNFVWDGSSDAGKQYANLIINQKNTSSDNLDVSGNLEIKKAVTLTGNVSVSGNLKINAAATLSGEVSVTGTTSIDAGTGNVTIDDSANTDSVNLLTGTVTITSAGDVTLRAKSSETITLANGVSAASLTVKSPVKLQNVTTTGDQNYNSTVSINDTGTTSLQSGGAITFSGNVSGPTGAGKTNSLSVQATTINLNCSSITTARAQTYTGSVVLGKDVELKTTSTNNGNITFSSTINSKDGENHSLTLNIPTTRNVTFNGNIGTSDTTKLTSLSVTGRTNINCASINTTADQTYNGTVNLKNGETTEISGADIEFTNTINGTNTFSINATSTTFGNTVGATTSLTSLSVIGATNINCASITTTGAQTYDGVVTIGAIISPVLTAKSGETNSTVTLKDGVTTSGTNNKLSVSADLITDNTASKTIGIPVEVTGNFTNKGTTTFEKAVTVSAAFTNNEDKSATFNDEITVTGNIVNNGTAKFEKNVSTEGNVTDTGIWNLNGTNSTLVFTGGNAQTFEPVATTTYKSILIDKSAGSFATSTNALNATTFADSNTNASSITFATNTTIGSDVTFHTAEAVTFTNTTNFITASSPDSYHDITHTAGLTKIEGTITAGNIILKKTELTGNTTLTSHGDVEFDTTDATVDGAFTLAITANNTTFDGNIGTTDSTKLATLSVTGATNINCASITTTGDQTYDGAVTLIDAGTTAISGADIEFTNTINGSNTFSVAATSTTFGNTVGATISLTSLSVTGATNINCASITTTGAQSYYDITLQQSSSLTGSIITLNGSVTDNTTPPVESYQLTINGNATTILGDGETVSIPIQINGSLTNTNTGTGSFNNDIKVTVDVTDNGKWNSTDGKKLIFNGSGAQVFTPVATTTYKSILIDKSAGSFATATNALNVTTFADSVDNASSITFATNTTIGSDVTFHTAEAVSFTNTTNFITAGSPASNHDITHTAGLTKIEGTITAGNITLKKTELTGNTTLTSHGDVEFDTTDATVDGAFTLAITANNTTFDGNIGTTDSTKLATLSVTGATNINCASITTTGDQTYDGAVTLIDAGTTAITGAGITFENTVIGKNALSITSSGEGKTAYFKGSVGATAGKELTSLSVTGNTQTCTASAISIITSGNQTYNGTVTLNKSTTFTARTTGASPEYQTVQFKNNVTGSAADTILTCNANLQVESITMQVAKEIDFAGNITGSGKTLTINSPVFKSTIASGTAEITLTKLAFVQNSTSLATANNTNINLNVPTIDGVGKTIVIDGTLKNITLTQAAVTIEPTIQTETGSKITASSETTTFKADVNLADGTLAANGGTIILTAANKGGAAATLSGNNTFNNLTFSGAVELTGDNTIGGTLLLTGTSAVTIGGSNEITNFTAGTTTSGLGGKTITFGANTTQTVTTKLTLNGSSESSKLKLRSSTTGTQWKIKCTAASNTSHQIQYVDVQDSNNISNTSDASTTAYNLFAMDSWDSGNNTNWNFPGMVYKWKTNATSTDWNTAANWIPASIPGKGANVQIQAPANDSAKHPVLSVALNLNEGSSEGTIEVLAGATFDLADQDLTVGTITNKGLVRLIGASGQTITGKMINGEGSTVEYYDTGATTTNFAWDGDGTQNGTVSNGKQYANLILNQNTSGSTVLVMSENLKINNPANLSGAVTVGGNLTIVEETTLSGSVSVTGTTTIAAGTGKNVSLNTDSNIFKGNVIVGNDDATNPVNAGAVTLNGIGKDTNNNNVAIFIENNVLADSLTINSNIRGSTLTINAPLTIKAASISTTGNQTYKKAVTLDKAEIHLQANPGSITFATSAPIDGTKELTITTTAGTTFNASVGSGTGTALSKLTVSGPLNVNCELVKSSGNQIYNANVNIAFVNEATLETTAGDISFTNANANVYGNKLTLKAPVKIISFNGTAGTSENPISELKITSASATTFEKPVYISTFTETVDPGTLTFKNGGKIVNPTVFNTTGNVTLTGELETQSLQMNNLIVDGTAKIKTSSAQTYNGTINGKTASTDVLNLDSGTGHITFNGDIGQSLPPLTLNVTGETTINCEAITTSGIQTYNSAITLGTSPAPETHTLTASGISFVSTIDGGADLALVTTAGTTFAANIGETTPPTSLTVTGLATIGCTAITTTGNQHYKNAVVLTASATLTSTDANLTFDSTIDGEQLLTLSVPQNTTTPAATYTITVTGKVGSNAATSDAIPSVTIAQAGNVSFAETVKTTNFIITQADNTLFNKAVNVTNFTITTAATTTFEELVQISTFTDAATAGDISFENGGTISAATEFKTSDTVTFGDNSADVMTFGTAAPYVNITHTAGDTSITGTLNAAAITLAQTTGGPMTILNTDLFKTVDGAALTYTTSFAQNGAGNSVLGGSFTGNGNASFATDLQLYGSPQADFGAAGTNISIAKNLIIIRAATDDLNINSGLNVTENLVLYKGPVVADANITVGKDILVLGSAYSQTDTSTGITNEYAYDCVRPETWSQINYTATLLPDGTAVPEPVEGPSCNYSSTLSVSAGKTISTAKNFYANGTVLSTNGTSGQWTLKVPDLTNAANAFAEAYHSEISGCKVICNDNSADGSKARLVCLECDDTSTGSTPNTNVDFDDFEITAAWTERDNSIRVEFNRPVRYYNQTVQTLKFQNVDGTPALNFTGLYSDPDCQDEIKYNTEMSYFYIKAAPQNDSEYGAWNTDATGRSSGADDDQSTDRSGIHHENIPALDFARALVNNGTTQAFIFTDRWGKRLNNYSSRTPTATAAYGSTEDTEVTHEVADKTGPVLYSVRTGQELHNAYDTSTGQASEHSYDSHNFIEFRYSEPVDFDGDATSNAALNADPTTAENVQVTDDFGALKNSDITAQSALTIAGLGIIQNGLIHTGKAGSTDKYVNALYRKDPYSINLSIAGYTEGTITDPNGNEYKNWTGYIEQAAMPTGTVTYLLDSGSQNSFVKDKQGNVQIKYPVDSCNTIPVVNSTEQGLYGAWDISEPVFAPVRPNKKTAWNLELFQKNYSAEAVGNNSGVGSTLDRIEFHLYDNTPEFDELGNAAAGTPEWFTEVGWCIQNSEGEKATDLYKSYTYAADIFGGARPYDNDTQRRTSGGIRYSTVHSAVNAFKYGIGSAVPENLIKTAFDNSKNTWDGASSLVFTGSSSPRRSAGDLEGLYFALPLENTSLDIKTSFTIKYDDSVGFITDLAGNRLRSKVFSTIDRTPPSIDMTVCPVGGDELEIIFVKELCIDSEDLHFVDNSGDVISITEPFDVLVNKCFDFITIDSSGQAIVSDLKIKEDVPAQISIAPNPDEKPSGPFFTKIHFKLSRTVTLEDIKNTYIRVTCIDPEWEYSTDKFTGHPGARVTLIQDANETGNNLQMYTAHALSDFAVGVINPLYAYDTAMTNDNGEIISDALFHKNLTDDVDTGSWAVHDWNRDQQNYGTLPAKRPVAVVADTFDGTEANENAPANFNIYLSNKPDTGSVSTQYNKDLEPSPEWRIWLPSVTADVFTSLSEKNNTNYSQAASALLQADKNSRLIFDVDKTITDLWSAGNQISFLFGLTNSDGSPVTIMHAPELDINHDKQYLTTSVKSPLYALRQTDSKDLLSLDLWSFRLKSNIMQRGGVSILNNVIDSSVGEKVVVRVDLEAQGKLEVLVMTLDGNIVDYLHRGVADKGEHFYSWDGSNRKGNPVARGMYFIRVIGDGIDETRKVMVVKE